VIGEGNRYSFQIHYVKQSEIAAPFAFAGLSFTFKLPKTDAKKQSQFAIYY
jgi:hypothetical protein